MPDKLERALSSAFVFRVCGNSVIGVLLLLTSQDHPSKAAGLPGACQGHSLAVRLYQERQQS